MTYTLYKRLRKQKKEDSHKKHTEEKERVQILKDNFKVPLSDFPDNYPINVKTFWSMAKKYDNFSFSRKNSRQKSNSISVSTNNPHFGTGPRFRKSELEKWKDSVRRFNQNTTTGKVIDVKRGPSPGPGAYLKLERWKGKKKMNFGGRKRSGSSSIRDRKKPGDRLMSMISKGPTKSIYQSKSFY